MDSTSINPQTAHKSGFENLLNFRDITTLSNNTSTPSFSSPIRSGRIYRSARPDLATPHDQQLLREQYEIHTILDLRKPTEHIDGAALLRRATGNPAASYPPVFPSIQRISINFNGREFSSALMARLSYLRQLQLILLYLFGWRQAAIAIMAKYVMAPRGLVGLAADSLAHCQREVKSVFDIFADEKQYPILVHCTQGKDRTGLVVLLVHLLMGTSLDGIRRDYLQTQDEMRGERAERVREMASVGFPESFADCPQGWIEAVVEIIESRYGGVEAYLDKCGVDRAQQIIIQKLLAEDVQR